MAFSIVKDAGEKIWVPVEPSATIYNGALVAVDSSGLADGISALAAASGVSNTSNKDIPFGVCLGNNLKTQLYNATYKTNYITAPAAGSSHGDTTEYAMVDGVFGKSDHRPYVLVELIKGTNTTIRGNIFNAAVGTAPTLLTATVASTDGLGTTTNATQFTPVANACTIYCRKGANKGAYRILDTTSTTVHTWTQAMNHDIAIGDQFVATHPRYFSTSYLQLGATVGLWVEASFTPAANSHYYQVEVERLDLSVAGQEFVEFRFGGDNFCLVRA
jgi:hypothetical protein